VEILGQAADAVLEALARQEDWGLTGGRDGEYRHDIVADAAALRVLQAAGLGVFSEESGLHDGDGEVLVVVDPVDGSTNASRGLPWWGVSLCALDAEGPAAAVVANPRTSERFEASRSEGARRNGLDISPSMASRIAGSVLGFNGYPAAHLGWAQYRSLGAAALDLCAVAWGALDGFVDCSADGLAPWDYLGGMLVCREAGAVVAEVYGRELVLRGPGERRSLVAAATEELAGELLAARRAFDARKIS
jgi:myo-inositol-1(or 4)-monophosphatase